MRAIRSGPAYCSAAHATTHRNVRWVGAPFVEILIRLRRNSFFVYAAGVPRRVQVIIHVPKSDLEFDFVNIPGGVDSGDGPRQFFVGLPKMEKYPSLVHNALAKPPASGAGRSTEFAIRGPRASAPCVWQFAPACEAQSPDGREKRRRHPANPAAARCGAIHFDV